MSGTSESIGSKKGKNKKNELENTNRRSMAPRSSGKLVAPTFDKPKNQKGKNSVHHDDELFITMVNEYRKQLPCQTLLFAGPEINNRTRKRMYIRFIESTTRWTRWRGRNKTRLWYD
ncbi:hypothetical protein T10_2847 [Trichinella papuae]|uniref:Uncharacterized protein n=1 Tax=Trichinella papuae TaxID=268474 RepID=A0A0V1MXC8_9BILA|nr:hypothetical protein T10_2847 [Trichinella papuae]